MAAEYSLSPYGEKFRLPVAGDYAKEFGRLKALVDQHRLLGREIVVVMGVGFVGAVMAAVIADTENKKGHPTKFVIGMQRPSSRSYWKIPLLNRGIPPVKAEDPQVDPMIERCVKQKKTADRRRKKTCAWSVLVFVEARTVAGGKPTAKLML